jgi:DNA-binding NtrC family response regulator
VIKPPYKLIIVDDEASVSKHLLEYIEDFDDFQACSYLTGEEALEALAREEAHACIVDMRLPGMDGIEFVRRARLLWPDCRFLIHTGSIDMDLTEELQSIGLNKDDLFYKPSDMNKILSHIYDMLSIQGD